MFQSRNVRNVFSSQSASYFVCFGIVAQNITNTHPRREVSNEKHLFPCFGNAILNRPASSAAECLPKTMIRGVSCCEVGAFSETLFDSERLLRISPVFAKYSSPVCISPGGVYPHYSGM